ncbi:MAG: hypothetical protein GSR83_01460 [Desulfurococcales archaeon]|nr:hypothetical protein [Desulfurococcales archaeon]
MEKPVRTMAILLVLLTLAASTTPLHAVTGYKKIVTREIDVAAVLAGSEGGEEKGVLSKLVVTVAYPGSGNVYVSTNPLTMLDTQAAARIAAMVAARMAGVNFWKYDYFYEMKSDSIIVGGPSASAAMTALTIACLLNTPVRNDTVVTGMINPDGTVGPVGGLDGKLHAVATRDKEFVIPIGQANYTYIVYEEKKLPFGLVIYRPVKKTVDLVKLGKKLGVQVVEAADISQVYYYLTGKHLPVKTTSLPVEYTQVISFINKGLSARYAELNNTYHQIIGKASSTVKKYARELYEQSRNYYNSSLHSTGTYRMYLLVQAGSYLEKANALINASLNDWAVTGYVKTVYSAVNKTLDKINKCTDSCTPLKVEYMTYIASLAEDSFNMFKSAVKQLDNRSGKLYLPVSLFGGVTVTPLYTLVDAHWKITLAGILYSSLNSYNYLFTKGPIVEEEEVRRAALEEAEIARSMQGYAVSLANELGVQPEPLTKALEFFDNATTDLNKGKYFSSLSYSTLAIEYSTISFIQMFGLKGELYIPSLEKMVQATLAQYTNNTGTPFASYMLYQISRNLVNHGDTETGYLLMEKAMLYASLYTLLAKTAQPSGTPSSTGTSTVNPIPPANQGNGSTVTTTETVTSTITITKTETINSQPRSSQTQQTLSTILVFAAIILVFAVGYGIGRIGR